VPLFVTTLHIRAPWNQSGNCNPIAGAEFRYRFSQLCVVFLCPFTTVMCDGVVQILNPPVFTLHTRALWNQGSNCWPLGAEFIYRFCKVCVFFRCPIISVDTGVQTPNPSFTALSTRSTRNQRRSCGLIAGAVFLYRINQFCIFFWCPVLTICTGSPITR
jgi:hypothetical protein